jgi:ADP-dependent phosphofructokinase/glucokinase
VNEEIILGFGNNVDYEIVWDSRVVEALVHKYQIQQAELLTSPRIDSERDLVRSILHFLGSGRGGERFVTRPGILEDFARRFEMAITLGGTSVRAAIAMRKLGHRSALHLVTINDHVRALIPTDSPYVCSNARESSYPHLIVQFDQGVHVQASDIDVSAPRANRIIYHNDLDNISMALNEDFTALWTNAKVLLISGFNAMQSEALLRRRLNTLLDMLERLPSGARCFYEDAGFYDSRFSRRVYAELAPRLDVVSMNEDELQSYLGRDVDVLHPGEVNEALEDLAQIIQGPTLVIHSMYWALACGKDAQQFQRALHGGVTMATTRFCFGDHFSLQDYQAVAKCLPNQSGAHFAEEIMKLRPTRIACVPVAEVEQSQGTTVGLGDAFVGGFLPALVEDGAAGR